MRRTVVTTETTTPAAFGWTQMLLDPERTWHGLIVGAADRVTRRTIAIQRLDVSFVRESCAVGFAEIAGRERLNVGLRLGMANSAA